MNDGCLVLTRRVGQKILIGDNIEVVVLGVDGPQVKIGVNAPRAVRVDREEVRERINAEKRAAAARASTQQPSV